LTRLCSSSAHSSTSEHSLVGSHTNKDLNYPNYTSQKSQCVISKTLYLHYFFLFSHLQVCFSMGHITLAKKLARKALLLLKRNFPQTWFGVLFQIFLEKYWHSCSPSQPPNNPSERLSLPMWTSLSSPRPWATRRSGCTMSKWPFKKAVYVGSPGRDCWPQLSSCRPLLTPSSALATLTSPSSWLMGLRADESRAFKEYMFTARPHTVLLNLLRFSSS
ncbi:uncharacterized protein LOC116533565, partial [Sapajus apella]|uniref:Uncharacterized protein LOC116533565 n=1 Tax=Sapajus apella TaxID=9515 RepID=A0A6J3FTX8_SAPAP